MGRISAGAVRREITPPVGIDLYGYILRFGKSKGVHDPLWAHFLSIDDGVSRVLLVSLDILFMSRELSLKVKEAISRRLGIEGKNILIACTHTHSAPGMHIFRNGGERDRTWEENVLRILVQGSEESVQELKKVTIGSGVGEVRIGENRKREGGPVDFYFPVICFKDAQELPYAVIANCGCHPVVLDEANLLISADYVGFFRNHLNTNFSREITTLFLSGACGDVDPVKRGSFSMADEYGKILAEEAFRITRSMTFIDTAEIEVREEPLRIPFGWIPSPGEAEEVYREHRLQYEAAIKRGEEGDRKVKKAFLLWAEELREKASKSELPSYLECELQWIKVGNAGILAFPFELFSSTSLSLRERSAIEPLLMAGYANGYCGYLPDEESFSEGGYEVESSFKYCGLLPLSPQAVKIFEEKALSMLSQPHRNPLRGKMK